MLAAGRACTWQRWAFTALIIEGMPAGIGSLGAAPFPRRRKMDQGGSIWRVWVFMRRPSNWWQHTGIRWRFR